MKYSAKIRAERAAARVTQAQVAEALGLDVRTLIDVELERIGVDRPTYQRISAAITEAASKQEAA